MQFSKITSIALAGLLSAAVVLPTMTTSAEARRGHGRGLAIGAGVVLGAAALAAASRRSYADDGYGYRSSGRDYCRRMRWQCDDGSRRACYKYDRDC